LLSKKDFLFFKTLQMLDNLSEDQIREIHKDEAISDLLEN